MKQALLCCSGGFSSTAVATALDVISIPDGYKWDAMGISAGGYSDDAFDGKSIVLVSPNIQFRFKDIKRVCDEKNIKTMQVAPSMYYPNKAAELWSECKKILNS